MNILLKNLLLPSATLQPILSRLLSSTSAELRTFVTFVLLLTSALHHIQKLGEANPFVPIIVGFLDELSTLMSSDNLHDTLRNQSNPGEKIVGVIEMLLKGNLSAEELGSYHLSRLFLQQLLVSITSNFAMTSQRLSKSFESQPKNLAVCASCPPG